MYNRNYGGFDYVRIHSELLRLVFNPKIIANLPVTDGYTRPLCAITHSKSENMYDLQSFEFN